MDKISHHVDQAMHSTAETLVEAELKRVEALVGLIKKDKKAAR
jgi:hypothetical protein